MYRNIHNYEKKNKIHHINVKRSAETKQVNIYPLSIKTL